VKAGILPVLGMAAVLVGGSHGRVFDEAGHAPPGTSGDPDTGPAQELGNVDYDAAFTFVRIQFGEEGGGLRAFRGRGEPPWAHDFPYADNNFVKILDEVTYVKPHVDGTNVIAADDPLLHRYPVAYMAEPGRWSPTEDEIRNLGAWLSKGGFLIMDDFRGNREWQWVEQIMSLVLPEHRFTQLTIEEPIFDTFFEIESLDFRPPTFQQYTPYFMGIHEDNDPEKRLLVIANFNNDIGDYWEYSDMGYFPIDLSNEAYKVGVNYVIYGLTR
jgi:hypothetical protein